MKKLNIKNLIKLIAIIFANILVFSIPLWFIFSSSVIEPIFSKILDIKIESSISGGPVIAKFYDDTLDDNGDGSYSYPLHENFSNQNIADIVSYEVFRPMIDNSLNQPLAFWQIAVSFSNLINPLENEGGFSNIMVAIYIDIDGEENGSTGTCFEMAEFVEFQKDHPWDIAIFTDGRLKD